MILDPRGCLHLDVVLRLGGTFDSAGFPDVLHTSSVGRQMFASHRESFGPEEVGGVQVAGDVRDCT